MTWIPKEPAFLKWFDTLTRWVRKRYTKLSCTINRIYAGPEAGKLFDEGRLDLILQWGEHQELFVEGNLSENRESWRKTKGFEPVFR